MIHELTGALLDELLKVDSPTISNAIETLNLRTKHEGFTPLQIRCQFPELGRLCGFAVTAQVETITQSYEKHEAEFIELFRAVANAPKPAAVVFQEIGPWPDYSAHCGEVMATIFRRAGAVGLVTDGAVRDVAELRKLNFQCFARGTVASHANFRIVRVNIPVQIMGLPIRPGDLLHGDENGLISIPKPALGGLLDAVESVRARERRLLDRVIQEDFKINDLAGRFFE
ncbi:MAG: RraA family protein [Terriglobia bacterium]